MPEIPSVPRAAELSAAVSAAFAPGGPLARALPGFEARQGQLDMADAVAAVFADGGVLLAEAGTGTGKTLAYLVPAILSGERVLISTGTKTLQEHNFGIQAFVENKVACYGNGALHRQSFVVVVRTGAVGVAVDPNDKPLVHLAQAVNNHRQCPTTIFGKVRQSQLEGELR